ncbi:MAG TPA: hypothetical protein VMW75_22830, partial [Thermoanaerobaculia bacterium]|nr:hypothetical protein [Thermoanaerobaculia bacterium]
MASVFLAYPSNPESLGQPLEAAARSLNATVPGTIETWRALDPDGSFIATNVTQAILESRSFAADITVPNFNVFYEVGYAIGLGKYVLILRNRALARSKQLTELGLFDTLGYREYENSRELVSLLRADDWGSPLAVASRPLNQKAPVYLLGAKYKTDFAIRISSRLKKARLNYRTFDPSEQVRLSAFEAIGEVSQSFGILVHLIPTEVQDSVDHNLRGAFLSGLAEGLGRVCTILQQGYDPVPLDFRDLVETCESDAQLDGAIADFAARTAEALQTDTTPPGGEPTSLLGKLSFGASSAENEMRDLGRYYLQTDAFLRSIRGEVRIVVGRKGSGKTALFFQLRDSLRRGSRNTILDLKPEGYKLRKFKEDVLSFLGGGSLEHTITAFWEYLLLLEVCHRLLENDKERHKRDATLFHPYRTLADAYEGDDFVSEGDFAERLSLLFRRIEADYKSRFGLETGKRLTASDVTRLLYKHDLAALRRSVISYLKFKESLWILVDNLDKGWPTQGLKEEDLLLMEILRPVIELRAGSLSQGSA